MFQERSKNERGRQSYALVITSPVVSGRLYLYDFSTVLHGFIFGSKQVSVYFLENKKILYTKPVTDFTDFGFRTTTTVYGHKKKYITRIGRNGD